MSQQNVLDGIYTKLSGDTGAGGVHTLTSGRIYEGQASQNAALPLVIFSLIADPPDGYFTRDDLQALFQVDVYSALDSGPEVCRVIVDRLYTLLHRQSVTVTNHAGVQAWCLERGVLTQEEDAHRIRQEWRLFGTTT